MHNAATMNSDVKALLTLLLLKTGTSSQEIHNSLQLAAASRVMMAEESATSVRSAPDATTNNVAKLRPIGGTNDIVSAAAKRMKQSADSMNSDIKALLTLLLLKNGAGSSEIQTALRMAAASRSAMAEEQAETTRAEAQPELEPAAEAATARQAIRNDQLAPVSAVKEFAA